MRVRGTVRKSRGRAGTSAAEQVPLRNGVSAANGRRREPQPPLKIASFFAGVGGIEVGLHRAGHQTVTLCENDLGAQAVLRHRFPEIPLKGDICREQHVHRDADLLTAGFPCQDLSQAGLTRGIVGKRSGLIGEVFRLIRRSPVPWLLLENVPFMMQLSRGRALEVIVSELESLGYKWAYRIVNTHAFGRPQRRRRVFLLASLDHDPRDVLLTDDMASPPKAEAQQELACGFYWTEGVRGLGWAVDSVPTLKGGSAIGIPSPPAILMPDGEIVKPDIRDAERLQGFRENWTRPAEAVVRPGMRWKLVGNAVSPPVTSWIGRRLREPGEYDGTWDRELVHGAPWPRAAWNVGSGRFVSTLSEWPVRRAIPKLAEFLKHPGIPLSHRAAKGFRNRTRKGKLNFPPGFLDAVDAHIRRMRQLERDGVVQEVSAAPL